MSEGFYPKNVQKKNSLRDNVNWIILWRHCYIYFICMYLFIYPVEIQIKSDMQCGEVWFCLDRIEAVQHVGELYLICCYV